MKKLFTLMIPALLVFCACETDFNNTKVPVNTTLPLTDFNISETMLLSWAGLKDEVTPGADGVLEINKTLEMTIGSPEDLKSIFTIPDQNFSFPVNLGGTIPFPMEIPINDPIEFNESFSLPNDYSIVSTFLKGGKLLFTIQNSISDFSEAICTVKQITKNGAPLTIKPGELKSLAGYKLDFKEGAKISFTLTGKIKAKAGDNLSALKLAISFIELGINEATGFFGRNVITPKEEFTLDIDPGVTDFFKDCQYYLANPSVKLKLSNAYNLPILVQISKLKIGNTEIALKNEIGGSKILVKPQGVTEYLLSNASTVSGKGLSEALSLDLSSLTVAFTVITNPTKTDVGDNNYNPPATNQISEQNSISVTEDITIPLDGWFTDIPFHQEFEMNLNVDKMNYDYFKLATICTNEMPLELDLSLVAVDHNNIEHVLFDEPIVIPSSNGRKPGSSGFKAGMIPETGAAIRTITGDNVQLLLKAKKLKFSIQGEMPQLKDGSTLKFYGNSNLQLKLIGNLKGEI